MIVDLPAICASYRASRRASRPEADRLAGVLSVLARGRTGVTLEREWRLTLALALKHLPPGACVVARDSNSREWYLGPAEQAAARLIQPERQPSDSAP